MPKSNNRYLPTATNTTSDANDGFKDFQFYLLERVNGKDEGEGGTTENNTSSNDEEDEFDFERCLNNQDQLNHQLFSLYKYGASEVDSPKAEDFLPTSNSAASNISYKSSSSASTNNNNKTCLKKNSTLAVYEDLALAHIGFENRQLNQTIALTSAASAPPPPVAECICRDTADGANLQANNNDADLDVTAFTDENEQMTSGLNLQSIALPHNSPNANTPKPPEVNKHTLTSSFNISSSQSGNGTNHSLFKDTRNSNRILEGLNKLRETKCLCDVILQVDGAEFCCHKCVLASLSDYFKAMFSGELVESKQSHVQINNIDALTMKLILDYAYTSELNIHENNVQALLTTANLFDIQSIKDACCRYMEMNMDPSNCVGIHCFSETHDCMELKTNSFNYILSNFCKVIMYDEYLTLQKSKLIEIISDDNLNVPIEDIVFNACIRWLDHSPETRNQEFHRILEHIRLPLLSAYFLYDKVQSEERIKQCDKSRELIQEAMMYNLLKDRRNQVQNERTRSRKSFSHLEALVVVGGEDDRVVLRTVDAYFPALDRWMPLQCSPYALSKHGVVACGENMLYMCGGEAPDSTPNETLWVFNTVLDEWKQLANLIVPRAELGMAIVDGCLYAVGGTTTGEKRLQSIERYDPLLNVWKNCACMKVAISSPAVCSLNGLLYVCGGTIGEPGELVDLVQCYNPASDTWKDLSSMLIPRTGCASCALNGLIYVIGGWYADDENSNRVEYYDPKQDKWLLCKSMIERRHRPAVAVLNNRIYVCGGEESFNLYHDTIECYDASIDEWQIVTCMHNGRSWLSCTTLRLQNPLFDGNKNEVTTVVGTSSYIITANDDDEPF